MTDLEILQNGTTSEKVYNVFTKYKPLIIKKACLYEKCSKGRIQKEDFVSDVYEALYYFVECITINKVKDISKFSYYKSVQFAISRIYWKQKKLLDCECLFEFDEDGNEKMQLISKLGFSEMAPDISKFINRLTERQKIIFDKKMKGETYAQIRKTIKVSHGTVVHEIIRIKKVYEEFFSIAAYI